MLGLVNADVDKFIKDMGGVSSLSNDELLEVCFVSLSGQNEYADGIEYLKEVKNRGICFSFFYNFAKVQWGSQSLISWSKRVKREKDLYDFWLDVDRRAESRGFKANSAPRQKSRVFSLLYALFFNVRAFSDMSVNDITSLRELVKNNNLLFVGDRPSSEFPAARKDLSGILFFIEEAYAAHGIEVDTNLIHEVIPSYLIKKRGRALSTSKRNAIKMVEINYPILFNTFEKFKQTLALKNPKEANSAFRTLLIYTSKHLQLKKVETKEDLCELLAVGRQGENRWLHYLENVDKKNIKSKASYIRDYLVWVMLEYGIDMDDGYEPLLSRLETEKVSRIQRKGNSGGLDETPKALIPYRVHQIATEILYDPDYTWAKELSYLYFENQYGEDVFNPTLINLIALLFTVPLRGIQAQCLDSGEGDSYKYNFTKSIWEVNQGRHANYWKSKGNSNQQRGFLCRDRSLIADAIKAKAVDENGSPIIRSAYMYINTNKTADRNVAFSDNSGYTIPWHHPDVISIVERQRTFIDAHHPVSKPSNFLELESKEVKQILGAEPTDAIKNLIPDRFYLFRCNLNPVRESWNFPPTKVLMVRTWNSLMIEIQRRLDEEGADFSIISEDKMSKFKDNVGGGNSYISYLTIHCTRVTGITRLEEAGVPINIISKFIAGHANIRTTFRYVKHDREYINQQVTEAQSNISQSMQISLSSDLKSSSLQEAKEMAYVPDIYSSSWEAVKERAWNTNTLGICPNAGTLCDAALKDNDFVFKGAGKCLNCKYLISGKAYLVSIWSHVNKLLYQAKKISDAYSELQSEYKILVKKRKSEFKANGRTEYWHQVNRDLQKLENHMESNSEEENMVLAEVYYGNLLFETVRELTNTDEEFVHGLDFEECSDFEHLNSIVESESFVPHFNRDKNLKFKRDTFVEMALMALGEQPIFLQPLSPEEKEESLSSVAKAIEQDLKNKEGKYLGAVMKINENSIGDLCLPM